jgi:hypothetical protein
MLQAMSSEEETNDRQNEEATKNNALCSADCLPTPPAPTAAESRAPELLQKYSQKKTTFTQKNQGDKKRNLKKKRKKSEKETPIRSANK